MSPDRKTQNVPSLYLRYDCGAMAHPAMRDPADAKDVRVPLVLLASKDEDVEAVQLFKSNLGGVESRVETFEI